MIVFRTDLSWGKKVVPAHLQVLTWRIGKNIYHFVTFLIFEIFYIINGMSQYNSLSSTWYLNFCSSPIRKWSVGVAIYSCA